jgi:DNA (cytosine-5)-methyltransferase 1
MSRQPVLLDLFSGAGGCAMGYSLAGFRAIGIDHRPQPRYPFEFHQMGWREGLERFAGEADVIHASPPCQAYTVSRTRAKQRKTHPDLLPTVRQSLEANGTLWVIESVIGSPVRWFAAMLCGGAFGLGATGDDGVWRPLRRHRLFESGVLLLSPGCSCSLREKIGVYGNGGGRSSRHLNPDRRGYKGNVRESRQAIGADWMMTAELAQAIPPAYTHYLGLQLYRAWENSREATD